MTDPANEPPGEDESDWRILAAQGDSRIDLSGHGVFDEVVVDQWLHVEKMDLGTWWMRIGDARVTVTVTAGAEPRVDVERGTYAETNGSTTDAPPAEPTGAGPGQPLRPA
ncbi:MAG TPA: hypothetical protein VMU51_24635 [Mycobacteriales bacterium]|nr:hypothetical protein [Mycobacteriales bacterium]